MIDVAATANADGKITSWDFHNYNSGGSGIRMLYDVPGAKTESHNANSPLRQGSYRALAATANQFARESAVDELAHAVKMDPREFRLKNLTDPRLRAVLEAAAKRFGWREIKSSSTRGFGFSVGSEKILSSPRALKFRSTRRPARFPSGASSRHSNAARCSTPPY